MEPDNPRLDDYILQQAGKPRPRLCFLPTASGDSQDYIERFYTCYRPKNCEPAHLSLFNVTVTDVEDYLLSHDIIYVGGGSTTNMLALWRHWGIDKALRKAYDSGIVLTGLSAGSICWFEQGLSEVIVNPAIEAPRRHQIIPGLGFIKGSHCPHYDGEAYRGPVYREWIADGRMSEGYAVDDGVGLHFVDGSLKRAVSSRTKSRAYRLKRTKEGTLETTGITPHYLP